MRNILEFSIEQGVGAPESEPHNGLRLGKPGKRGRCVAELGVEWSQDLGGPGQGSTVVTGGLRDPILQTPGKIFLERF